MVSEAIIISEDHYNALGVIRSLGEQSIHVHLILTTQKSTSTYTNRSKYVKSVNYTGHNESLILSTISKLTKIEKSYFLFPLSDYAAMLLDKSYHLFGSNIACPNMNGEMLAFQNKEKCKQLAECCGMKTADSLVVELGESFDWSIFPAIIKPLISQEGAKTDITIVNSSEELCSVLEIFRQRNYSRVLLEKYLTGSQEHMVEVLGCSTKDSVFIGGIIKKIREYPMMRGSTSYAEIVFQHEGINTDIIKAFIEKTGFKGLFDVEYKYVDGECYFIECNFRNGAPSYALTQYGCNLPYNWIALYEGESVKGIDFEQHNNMFFMCEQTDVLNMFKRQVPFNKWINEFRHSKKIFMVRTDCAPAIKYYADFIAMIIKRVIRR